MSSSNSAVKVENNQGSRRTPRKLKEIYNAVLGVNVAFLPILVVFLAREAKTTERAAWLPWAPQSASDSQTVLPLALAIMISLLITFVIVSEWWMALDFFDAYDFDAAGVWHSRAQTILNLLYLFPLLGLSPLVLMQEELNASTLVLFAITIASLCILDILEMFPCSRGRWSESQKKTARKEIIGDLILLLLYGTFAIAPALWEYAKMIPLFWYVGALLVIYAFDVFGRRWLIAWPPTS